MIIWITGLNGAGKTTLAKQLKYIFSSNILNCKENINSKEAQADIYFTRGNILDKRNDYKGSCNMFKMANNLTRQKFKSNYKYFKSTLKKEIISLNINKTANKDQYYDIGLHTPIFTVGLPRAGKSTIESILSYNKLVKKQFTNY